MAGGGDPPRGTSSPHGRKVGMMDRQAVISGTSGEGRVELRGRGRG